jgi:4-hydroxybenzoate polyprenyltransferase
MTPWRAAIEACFYGHLFYGVCAVAQVIETSVQLALPVDVWLTVGVFIGTVSFYDIPYGRRAADESDPRGEWHRRHRRLVNQLRQGALFALVALSSWMVIRHRADIQRMTVFEWMVLLAFPCAGALYYRWPATRRRPVALRESGWLKPFAIGFVWAGVAVAYPILFARVEYGHVTPLSFFPCLLFVKTLMFVAVLAMVFDIKDHDADRRAGLSTVVTLVGPERTISHVSLPLTVLGIVTALSYATMHHLTPTRVLLVLAPFGLLVAGIVSLRKPRTILYYLTIIDGLMLAKASLDIVATRF